MDFSPESLDFLEEYIFKISQRSIEEKDNIGETFRKNLRGAQWDINLEKENLAYYGLPLITGAVNQISDYCPHMDVVTVLHRKSGNYLRTLLEKAIAKQNKN